jgi:alkaline phosphatase D
MKKVLLFISIIVFVSCKTTINTPIAKQKESSNPYYTIAFGSCDNQRIKNELWEAIDANNPSVWIWGGDNVYSDTENMAFLKANYDIQKKDSVYLNFIKNKTILGTWDDHDYGLNDGGQEYPYKKQSQQLLYDFLDTPKNAPERKRDGVYNVKNISVDGHKIKIIVLDTRFFRTALSKAADPKKRFQPNEYGKGTILGEAQWKWLEKELQKSKAQFNVIVSSVQFLSDKHGFESWGNFPHEVDKLEKIIVDSKAKGTFILSGDRHISLFSSKKVKGLAYPLIDFTSSGLTHTYTSFAGEENPYLVGEVVKELNFGILKFDFENNKVMMEIRGKENKLLTQWTQEYSVKPEN